MKKKAYAIFALLCAFAQGTWAQTAPDGLSIDTDYSSDQEGYYYVNMTSTQVERSITFTETDLAFKVYDDGGKNGNNGKAGYSLQLQAPDGYCFEVEGTFTLEDDVLAIYNSSWDDQNNQLYYFESNQDGDIITSNISRRRTTGNYMFIEFFSQSDVKQPGFELTVRIKPLHILRGEGTDENPYEVWSSEAWNELCSKVAGGETFAGKYVKQMLDIDVTKSAGTTEYPFSGHYDGNGHKMNCTLNQTDQAAAPFHNAKDAEIKNLHVAGSIRGGIHSAGMVAFTDGEVSIQNCHVSAHITFTGNDTNGAHGGGFVGHAQESTVRVYYSLFDGMMTALSNGKSDMRLGAIIGWAGSLTDVRYTLENGTYEGAGETAFCWKDESNTDLSATGSNMHVSALNHDSGTQQGYSVLSGSEGLVLNFDGEKWEETFAGAGKRNKYDGNYLIGDKIYAAKGSSVSFTATYPTNRKVEKLMANDQEAILIVDSYSFTQGESNTLVTAIYSSIYWTDESKYATAFATVDQTKKIVTITTPEEFALLAKQVNDSNNGLGWTYKLDADLDMSKYDWKPVGYGASVPFAGTFDGQGHTISGVNVTDDKNYGGLFGLVYGAVNNVKLTNSKIEGKMFVGGIAGSARYDIVNCYVGDDVTVTASDEYCGGVVGSVFNNQNQTDNYDDTEAWVRGCYSAATVSGKARVGGIAGNLGSGTVHWCVSNAKVSSTNGTVAYEVGNKAGGTMQNNFYIGKEAKINDTDTHTVKITLSPGLDEMGFAFDISKEQYFNVSDITIDHNLTVKVGDDLYARVGSSTDFSIPEISGGCKVENVKVNGVVPTALGSGVYRYKFTEDSKVTGEAAINLYDDSNFNDHDESRDNNAILTYNNHRLVNVTIQGRTLYKDGCWNTICLPFDIPTTNGTIFEGAEVKTFTGSSFDEETGTLTLNFTEHSITYLQANMPYIVKWENDGSTIVNPKFEQVFVEFNYEEDPIIIGDEENDPAVFGGIYLQSTFPPYEEGYRNFLYMGADNKLYFPDGTGNPFFINCFRAYFKLRDDIVAGDLGEGLVKSITLSLGDGTTTTGLKDILTPRRADDTFYRLDGVRLNSSPTAKGIYIQNGRKVMVK